jgi:hypothetical protein
VINQIQKCAQNVLQVIDYGKAPMMVFLPKNILYNSAKLVKNSV